MNAVFKSASLALLLLIAMSPIAHADNLPAPLMNDPRFSFLTTSTNDNITMRYNPGSVVDVPGLKNTIKTVNEEIGEFFGDYPYTTTVAVAGTNSEFGLLINVGNAPDTAKALNWNVGYNGLIITKSPAMLSDFRQTFKHQLARIAVRTLQEHYKSLPEWYQDGVASFVAGDLTPDQRMAVSVKAVTGPWLSLDEIERAYRNMTIYNYGEQKNIDARSQAAALVDDIGTRFGGKALIEIVEDYTEDGNLTQAFVNQTTFTPEALNNEFRIERSGSGTASPDPTAVPTNTIKPGSVPSPTPSPTTVPGGQGTRDDSGSVPKETDSAWSLPSTGDILLYGSIAVVNLIGIIAVLIILRRNWH